MMSFAWEALASLLPLAAIITLHAGLILLGGARLPPRS